VVGSVDSWDDAAGWGVLRTPDGLSVFCLFSQVEDRETRYRSLQPGQVVWFDYEVPGQDGCDARVLTAARAGESDPHTPLGSLLSTAESSPTAYTGSLTIRYRAD